MERYFGLVARILRDLADDLDRAAAGEGPLLAVVYFLAALAATAALIGILRRILPGRRAEDATLRELLDQSELRLQRVQGDIALAQKSNDRLAAHDPKAFLKELQEGPDTAGRAAAIDARIDRAQAWLAPMRPALAEAYAIMAKHRLASAESAEDVEAARMLAMGAVAAEPGSAACAEILTSIEEAVRLRIFDAMSEADTLAWKVLRLSGDGAGSALGVLPDALSLIDRSKHRMGRAIQLSGWEPQELRLAALAQLTRPARGIAEQHNGMATAVPAHFRSARDFRKSGASGELEAAASQSQVAEGRAAGLEAAYALVSGERLRVVSTGDHAGGGMVLQLVPSGDGARKAGGADVGPLPPAVPGPEGNPPEPGKRRARNRKAGQDGGDAGPPPMSETEAELRRLYERRSSPDMLGEKHPRTIATRANIAHEIGLQGRHAEAEAEFRAIRDILRRPDILGKDHIETLTVWHNLAHEIARQGRHDEALSEFDALLEALNGPEGPGETHPLTLAARHGLGTALAALGRTEEAEAEFRAVWDIRRRPDVQGEDHPQTLWTRLQFLNLAEEAKD